MFGKLILVSPDLPNAPNVEVLTSTEKIEKVEGLMARETDSGGKDAMKDRRNKDRISTGLLICLRCGLRKPRNDGSKYCPNCGIKMIEEGSLPYVPKFPRDEKDAYKNILKGGKCYEQKRFNL